jgi:hypothetical protein
MSNNPESLDSNLGEPKQIHWEIVARTAGLMPAQIIVGRLNSLGIPARAWQEGAGDALGLTIGLLGTGHVEVPEEFVDQALEILADDVEEDEYYDDDEEYEDEEFFDEDYDDEDYDDEE